MAGGHGLVLVENSPSRKTVLSHCVTSFNELISTFRSTTGKKVHPKYNCYKTFISVAAQPSAVRSKVSSVFL